MREGYGLSRGADDPKMAAVRIPPMPVAWTSEVVRELFPVRIGIGRDVDLIRRPSGVALYLRGPQSKMFPATVQGWIDLWRTMAGTTKPDKLQYCRVQVYSAKRAMTSTPFRDAEAALVAEALGRLVLPGLIFLGGHDYGEAMQPDDVVDMRASPHDLVLTSIDTAAALWSVAARRVVEVEASGPGATTAGAFVATTGHGLAGDLLDRYSAQWMTDRFGKKTVATLIRLETDASELFLRSVTETPESAQVALSAVRALARGRPPRGDSETAGPGGTESSPTGAPVASLAGAGATPDDLVSALERLARLRSAGALTETEYELAKAKLLA